MALQTLDATAAVANQTYSVATVDTDGLIINAPPGTAEIHLRISAAGVFSGGVSGAAELPIDANTYTEVWTRGTALPSSPRIFVRPSTGTATVYARVV